MTVDEIFMKLATHMIEGVMTHDKLAQAYDFLGLCGFAKCHLYHQMKEMKDYECLMHYYSTHYHKLLPINEIPNPDIIPQTWYKYTTMAVDTNTKRQATKTMMEAWVKWEQDTKQLYQDMYSELHNLGEIAAADKIKCYVRGVTEELKHAEKKWIKLETIDYNIGSIVSWQQPMYKKFKKELTHLYD